VKYLAFSSASFFLAASSSSGVGTLTSSFLSSFFLSSFFPFVSAALGSFAPCLVPAFSSFFSSGFGASASFII